MATQAPGIGFQGFSQSLSQALDDHAADLKNRIASEALQLASSRSGSQGQVSIDDLSMAIGRLEGKLQNQKRSKLESWFSFFSPFTCACVFLCVAFGLLAWKPVAGGSSAAFLDIAKIFAGTIVGSASSAAISKPK